MRHQKILTFQNLIQTLQYSIGSKTLRFKSSGLVAIKMEAKEAGTLAASEWEQREHGCYEVHMNEEEG